MRLLTIFFVVLCSSAAHAWEQPPLFAGEVWGPAEDQAAAEVLAGSIATARENAQNGLTRRDAHPKAHGCVRAHWKNLDLTGELGYEAGFLSRPGAEYDAWLRFSNGSPGGAEKSDAGADVRGLAVKLLGVPSTPRGSQDFVAMSARRFFSRDAADYLSFFRAVRGGKGSLALYLLSHPTNAYLIYQASVSPSANDGPGPSSRCRRERFPRSSGCRLFASGSLGRNRRWC